MNIDSVVKAAHSDAGSVQVAVPDFPLRAIQVMPVCRHPVFEIRAMRRIDESTTSLRYGVLSTNPRPAPIAKTRWGMESADTISTASGTSSGLS